LFLDFGKPQPTVTNMQNWYAVIAFKEPPATFGFYRAKSGKSWVRKIQGKEWAISLGNQLAALDIHGVIKKSDKPRNFTNPNRGKNPQGFTPSNPRFPNRREI